MTSLSGMDTTTAAGLSYKPRSHWSIQLNPTEYDQAVWDSRMVVIGNRDLTRFVSAIRHPDIGLLPPH
jgi:hypothetical protein